MSCAVITSQYNPVLYVIVMSWASLGPRRSPYFLCRASDIAEVGTTFNELSYDVVLVEHRTHHLPDAERMRYVLFHGRSIIK